MSRIVVLLAVAALIGLAVAVAVAPPAESQDVPSSPLATTWIVETRRPQVVGRLAFVQTDIAGEFDVSGLAMLRLPASRPVECGAVELFDVQPVSGGSTPIAFAQNGQLKGTLRLTGRDFPDCEARLDILRGSDRQAISRRRASNGQEQRVSVRRLSLRGRLTVGNSTRSRIVRLRGAKTPTTTLQRRWRGESDDARVRGTRIHSDKFGLHVTTSSLGFPFLDFDASGAARLDGTGTSGLSLTGTIAVARNRRGLVQIDTAANSSVDLGTGWGRSRHFIASKLANPSTYRGPRVVITTRVFPTGGGEPRRVDLKGDLDILP